MSDADQATAGAGVPDGPRMSLTLVPQEPRFVVRLPGRIARTGSSPIQVALPRLFHQRLRVGTSGSLNHALIALVRQALAWLEAEKSSLRIDSERDPLKAAAGPLAKSYTETWDLKLDAAANWQLPHAMFESRPRDPQVLVEVRGRPSRQDIVHIQIGLPDDIQLCLQEQGLGAISQLVAYLARYAYMRLQTEKLSLHVTVAGQKVVESPSLLLPGKNSVMSTQPFVVWPIATVGELIEQLRKFPSDTAVGLTDTVFDVNSGIIGLGTEREPEPTGTLMLVGELFVKYEVPGDEGE